MSPLCIRLGEDGAIRRARLSNHNIKRRLGLGRDVADSNASAVGNPLWNQGLWLKNLMLDLRSRRQF